MSCQTGDRNALSVLVSKWQPAFLKYAIVMTRNPDLAADVMQEAWIKIIRSLPKLRDPLKFQSWAYRIVNNQCLDLLRKQRHVEPEVDIGAVSPFKALESADQIESILQQLTPEHRSVLALHYLQAFDVKDIAAIIGKPEGTVKSRLFHAREKFKQLFEDDSLKGEQHERSGQPDSGSLEGSVRPA